MAGSAGAAGRGDRRETCDPNGTARSARQREPRPAAGRVQISVEAAVAALDSRRWGFVVAEDRPRAAAAAGVDAVIRARRLC
jgi:hypothetical protein